MTAVAAMATAAVASLLARRRRAGARSLRDGGWWRWPVTWVSSRTAVPPAGSALPDGRTPRGHPGCCDAESPVVPPGSTPQRRVQGVAAVDNIAPRDHAAQVARAEPGEFWPFSEQQHDMRVLSYLGHSGKRNRVPGMPGVRWQAPPDRDRKSVV